MAKKENKSRKELLALRNAAELNENEEPNEEPNENKDEKKIECGPFNSRDNKHFVCSNEIFKSLNSPNPLNNGEIPNCWTKTELNVHTDLINLVAKAKDLPIKEKYKHIVLPGNKCSKCRENPLGWPETFNWIREIAEIDGVNPRLFD